MTRRRVLMIPSWYPTKDNPIGGSFFREQAAALGDKAEIVVACVEFVPIKLRSVLKRLLLRSPLCPQVAEHNFLDSPPVFKIKGYGLRRGPLGACLPLRRVGRAIDDLNARLERRTYLAAYEHAERKLGFKAELIYAMTAQVNGGQAYELGQGLGLPVVLAEHSPFSVDAIPAERRERVKRAFEGAAAVLTVSHDKSRQVLMGNIECAPVVVGNMVDGSMFTIAPRCASRIPNLLMVAAYNFYKDYPTFFRTIAELRRITNAPFRVTVLGFAPTREVSPWAEGERKFMELVERFGVADITTASAFAAREEMPRHYAEADAFVLTSIQEGLPVSALEAMASGLPVFSTRCGGVEDLVDDSCGRVRPVRDHRGLASDLKDYLEGRISFDPAHIRDTVLSRYGAEAFTARLVSIFESCVEGKEVLAWES